MLRASHIAAAPSAATGRFDRPSDRLSAPAFGGSGVVGTNRWSGRGSEQIPE
jgi:hypothetical protein